MFLGNALQALYNTVDSVWVGQFLGREALAGVSVSFPIIFATVALAAGIGMAATTLVAQHAGARDAPMVRKTVTNSLVITGILGIVLSTIGVSARTPLLRLIQTPAEVMKQADSYLGIVMAGLTATFFYNIISSILRGLGDSRTPLIFLVYATVLNIILDPLMIFGVWPFPRMEVAGAALATVVAQAISAILGFRHLIRTGLISTGKGEWALDRQIVKQTFAIGLPAGVQQIIVSTGMLTVTSLVNSFGAAVTAAFGVGARLEQFVTLPAMTVGLAVTALVGQNLGAREFERVKQAVRSSVYLTSGITGVVSIVVISVPHILLRMFTSDADVITEGVRYLRTFGFAYVPMGLMFTLAGIMRGAGDTFPSMLISIVTLWIVRIPAAYYLSRIFGSRGLWLGMALSPAVGASLNYAYYLSGRWRRRVLTRQLPAPESPGVPRPGDQA